MSVGRYGLVVIRAWNIAITAGVEMKPNESAALDVSLERWTDMAARLSTLGKSHSRQLQLRGRPSSPARRRSLRSEDLNVPNIAVANSDGRRV
jgi:hypothetical protein